MMNLFNGFLSLLNKLKIPTLLGLTIIISGMVAGVILIIQNQPTLLSTKASSDQTPKEITISNLESDSASISWQTTSATPGFITFGINSAGEQTVLDDRDAEAPQSRVTHHVTLKKLTPSTAYQFKIYSGKFPTEVKKLTTTSSFSNFNDFNPVVSSALQENQPVLDGIVYLSIPGAQIQSAPIKNLGNFIIPVSKIRTEDLSAIFIPDANSIAKLTIISDKGQASVLFKLTQAGTSLGPIKIGQNLDLTTNLPTPSLTNNLIIFDLDGNGVVNVADYSIVLKCLDPKKVAKQDVELCQKANLNAGGQIDQKYLEAMIQKMKDLGQPIPTVSPKP